MPLYDFRCDDCGEAFEVSASFAELEKRSVCPTCGGRHTSRVYGAVLLGGKRTSVKPENFVRPRGPVTPQGPAKPRKP
jgi:putative FmdB family regulatory protein